MVRVGKELSQRYPDSEATAPKLFTEAPEISHLVILLFQSHASVTADKPPNEETRNQQTFTPGILAYGGCLGGALTFNLVGRNVRVETSGIIHETTVITVANSGLVRYVRSLKPVRLLPNLESSLVSASHGLSEFH